MIDRFKLFAVMAVAAFALTAAAAAAAQAAPAFHVETAPATITGEQTTTEEFATTASVITCTGITLKGSTTVTETTTQEVIPTCTGAKAFGFLTTTVNFEGCGYLFHLVANGVSPYPATTDINCPEGRAITVSSAFTNCIIRIFPQTGLTGVTFTNNGSKTTRDLNVSENISGLRYTQTGSNCVGGEGNFTNGTEKGGTTMKADVGSTTTQQGLFIS